MTDTTDPAEERLAASAAAVPDLITLILRRAATLALQGLQAALAECEIRPIQFVIIDMLGSRPGVRQSQLSPALGIRRTNLVPLLSELERRGLCERRPVPGDRRAAALFLTERGSALRERCQAEAARHEDRMISRIGQHGRHQLVGLLHQVSDAAFDPPTHPPEL